MAPISEQIQEVITFREKNRGSKFFNHLSAVSESIQALGWVALVRAKGGARAGSYSCRGSRLPTASFSTGCKARPLCERDDRCCHVLHKPSPQGVQRCVSLAFARGGAAQTQLAPVECFHAGSSTSGLFCGKLGGPWLIESTFAGRGCFCFLFSSALHGRHASASSL